ncbi:hypothetical protein CsSME_00007250 [Camellia sinensis var. sinensis]
MVEPVIRPLDSFFGSLTSPVFKTLLPITSSSTSSTHDTVACCSSRGPTFIRGSDWNPSGGILHRIMFGTPFWGHPLTPLCHVAGGDWWSRKKKKKKKKR